MVIRKTNPQYKIIKVGGREMRVPLQSSGLSSPTGNSMQSYDQDTSTNRNQGGGCLCFFLGSFGPLGLIVAAIIAKREGVISALWGFFISWAIIILAYFALLGKLWVLTQ